MLAAHGGPKAVTHPIAPWPGTDNKVESSVLEALRRGEWGLYDGPWTQQLCESLCQQFSCEHSLLTSSGTIAVELALRAAGVRAGDEVMLAAYDFPGNFRAIEAIGAMPVLVDVVSGSWVTGADLICAGVSESTKAILVSHLHGQLVDIPRIRSAIQEKFPDRSIAIVEDACQVPGARCGGIQCGAMGDVSVLSFGGSKLLSAGRGGAVLSNDAAAIQRAKVWSNRGNEAFPLSQLQAAALLPQLNELGERNAVRSLAVKKLIEDVESRCGAKLTSRIVENESAWYKVPFLLPQTVDREMAIQLMQAEGVPIDIGFRGFAKRTSRRCRKVGDLAQATVAAERTLLLHHPALLEPEATRNQIVDGITKVMEFLNA